MLEKSNRSFKNMPVKRFLLGFVIFLCSVGTFEVLLRLLNYPYIGCRKMDEVAEYQIGRYDPQLGWSYAPSRSVNHWDNKTYTFSKEGYRAQSVADEPDYKKPFILIVGDSFLFGHGLDFDETFGHKLAVQLHDTYNVLNFAVQGYGLDQVYLRLQQLIPKYNPRYVIVDIHEDQDYRNVNRDRRAFFPCSKLTGTKPVFSLVNNQLVLMHPPERFETYDEPRLRLLVRRVGEVMSQKSNAKDALSKRIYQEMKQYVTAHHAELFEINYQMAVRDYQTDGKTASSSAIVVDYGKEYAVDGVHPNGNATTRMVKDFMNAFGTVLIPQ